MLFRMGRYSIALDRHDRSANVNFVSHAHSDHTAGLRRGSGAVMSMPTMELLAVRGKKVAAAEMCNMGKMLDAGHILGSKQLYVELEDMGTSVLYSGDYQMQKSFAAEGIRTTEADLLVIDSTYPYANVIFDDRDEVAYAMQLYVKRKLESGAAVVFGTYTMGKAQELIKVFNDIGIAPVVDEKIAKLNEVYAKFGIKLDYASSGEEGYGKQGDALYITSNSKLTGEAMRISETGGKRVYTAMASGFAKTIKFSTDVQFPLSDHADFRQALEYIERCNPKRIFTVGSNRETMAKNLKAEGLNATAAMENGISISVASNINRDSQV